MRGLGAVRTAWLWLVSAVVLGRLVEVHGGVVEEEGWQHEAVLAADGTVSIKWKIHDGNFTCQVSAATLGWVGLGLSPTGAMKNSDLVIFGVKNGQPYIGDMYSGDGYFISKDTRQDCHLLAAAETTGTTKVTFTRKLKPECRPGLEHEDRVITDDTQHVLYAYHSRDPDDLASPQRHENRGQKTLHLTDPVSPTQPREDAEDQSERLITWSAIQQEARLPNMTTVYWCRVLRVPILDVTHHAIKYRPVITPGNEAVVHHMVLYRCSGRDFTLLEREAAQPEGYQCYSANMPPAAMYCRGIVAGWGVGGEEFTFPNGVGFPMGPGSGADYYIIEVHYDIGALEPHAREVVDSSGLEFTLTPNLRLHEASMLTVGSDVSQLQIVPPRAQHFTHVGHCSDECLHLALPESGITLFAALPHTHLLGHQIRVRHFRHGREMAPPLLRDDGYDFNYQQLRHVTNRRVYPGDQLTVECVYNSDRDNVTLGGLSTDEEMCVVFLQYYPAIPLAQCVSWPEPWPLLHLLGVEGVERQGRYGLKVAEPAQYAGLSLQQYLQQLDWGGSRVQKLQETLTRGNHTPECYEFGRRVLSTTRNTTSYPAGASSLGWLQRPLCESPTQSAAASVATATVYATVAMSLAFDVLMR